MMPAAAHFDTALLLDGLNRSVMGKEKDSVTNGGRKKDPIVSRRSYTRRQKLNPAEKLLLRRERNRITAQASRIKAKQEEGLLKQQLFKLEFETMKLLLENEALRRQSIELEAENQNLKFKTQNLCHRSIVKGNDVEATFRHAWFVNIPLQKGWVLLKIFLTLIISIWETVVQNMSQNYRVLYVRKLLNLIRKVKQNLSVAYLLPLMAMTHLSSYLCFPVIPNG